MELKAPQELLSEGINCIKANDYAKATDIFSSALDQSISDKSLLNSLYVNRSTTNYLIGNDFNAFYDACKAIETDPANFEGYLRRSNVYLIYSLFNEALQDMNKALELNKDPQFTQDLRARVAFMEKVKQQATAARLPESQNILSANIPENLTLEAAKSIGTFIFDNKKIPKEDVQKLFTKLKPLFESDSKSCVNGISRITVPKITVLGRIDGYIGKLFAFFDKNGYPSKENVYLINGNFIGREDHRVLMVLFLFKAAEPSSIFFTQGLFDTEGGQINGSQLIVPNYILNPLKCIESEYGTEVMKDVSKIVSELPLCYIVNDRIAVMSSGPSKSGPSLWGQFSCTQKNLQIEGFPMFCFGRDDVEEFLTKQGISKLICSNKVLSNGFESFIDGKFINVSFGKTDHRVFGYKLGYAVITGEEVETKLQQFDFFPLVVHYNESNPYYEGLFFHMRKYTDVNPARAGFVRIKAISEDFVPVSETIDTSIYMYSYMSVPAPGSWIIVDFGSRKVDIEHYMIESAPLNKNNDHMKTWKIEGSDDLQNWSLIDLRENVDELNGPLCHMVFKVDENKRKPFRFIKILQHEKNHRGNWNLCLGHFDFYGTIQELSSSN
ncbi:hypothetical protein M9Y10_038536 [Tritrichomonas musculus]|uniref:Serine/threonine specific protein phosphatases domain-containing protein n=1 Tax=Tritrichomonas musculus TaxID=1915356 RepID=A0ABR2K8N2_9EUKA